MKKMLSIPLSIIMSIVLFINVPIVAFASSCDIFSNNDVCCKPGEEVDIPIMIKGNPGIMGFSITLSFNEKELTPLSVKKGDILSKGIFDNSIDSSAKNKVTVVWSSTENNELNGELFIVKFKVTEDVKKNCDVKISYSQADTFNESWKDVVLNCEDVIINIEGADENIEISPYDEWKAIAQTKSDFERFLINVFVLPILYLIYEIF